MESIISSNEIHISQHNGASCCSWCLCSFFFVQWSEQSGCYKFCRLLENPIDISICIVHTYFTCWKYHSVGILIDLELFLMYSGNNFVVWSLWIAFVIMIHRSLSLSSLFNKLANYSPSNLHKNSFRTNNTTDAMCLVNWRID